MINFIASARGVFRTRSNIYDGAIFVILTMNVDYFRKKAPSHMFNGVLNTPEVSHVGRIMYFRIWLRLFLAEETQTIPLHFKASEIRHNGTKNEDIATFGSMFWVRLELKYKN